MEPTSHSTIGGSKKPMMPNYNASFEKSGGDVFFLLMILTLPFQGQGIYIGSVALSVNFIFAIFFVVTHINYVRLLDFDIHDLLFYLFLIFSGLSLLHNYVFGLTQTTSIESGLLGSVARGLIHIFRFLFIFLLYKSIKGYLSAHLERRVRQLYKTLFLAAAIPAIYGTYQMIGLSRGWPFVNINNIHKVGILSVSFPKTLHIYRVFATFGEPKGYGAFLVSVIPLLVGFLLSRQTQGSSIRYGRHYLLFGLQWILIIVLVSHLFLTVSRGAYLSLVIGLGLLFILGPGLQLVPFLLAGALIALAWMKVPIEVFMENIIVSYLRYLGIDTVVVGPELLNFRLAWDVALAHPVFGLGLGNFAFYVASRGIRFVQSDIQGATNFASYLLANTGLVGSFLFIFFLGSHLSRSFIILRKTKAYRRTQTSMIFVLVSMIMAFAEFVMVGSLNDLLPWIVLALAVVLLNRIETQGEIFPGKAVTNNLVK